MTSISASTQKVLDALANFTNKDGQIVITPEVLAEKLGPKPKAEPKRDPDAPRGPRSAFFFWVHDHRNAMIHELQSEDPDVKFKASDINKALSDWWKTVSAENKAEYKKIASEDRQRYNTQITEYREKNGLQAPVRKSTCFNFDENPSTPAVWFDSVFGFLERSPVDPKTGKKITKGFHNFDEAVAEAVRLGAGGITKTRVGYKIRMGTTISINEASRSKGEMSWTINK